LVLLASFMFIGSAAAQTTNQIYIAQTASGHANGTDYADAYPVTWFNTASNWTAAPTRGMIGPGTTVILCGNIITPLTAQGSGTSGDPVTILFGPGATMSQPALAGDFINVSNQSYITIDGGATGQIGGYNGNPSLANGIIEDTDNGTNLGHQVGTAGVEADQSHYITVQNLVIENLYVHVPGSDINRMGAAVETLWNGGATATNITINNCIFHDMLAGFYIGYGPGGQNITMTNTTVYNVNWGEFADPHNSDLSNSMTNLIISNDYFHDWANWDDTAWTFHHDGAIVGSNGGGFSNIIFSNNVCDNTNWGANSTACFYPSSGGAIGPVLAYNNLFIGTPPSDGDIYYFPGPGSNMSIYNNTFIGGSTIGNAITILGNYGGTQTYTVENNIVTGDLIFINLPVPVSNLISDYNIGYNLRSLGGYQCGYLACWQAEGYDLHDPNVVDGVATSPNLNANYVPQSSSPAIGTGVNLSSYFTTDINGNTRSSTEAWDIGAYASSTTSTSTLYGDVNGAVNGSGQPVVTIVDSEMTAQAAVGLITLTSTQQQAADVDGTGAVDIYDAYLISEYAAGLITQFPVRQ
jgi:hypothetical protein